MMRSWWWRLVVVATYRDSEDGGRTERHVGRGRRVGPSPWWRLVVIPAATAAAAISGSGPRLLPWVVFRRPRLLPTL